MSKDDHKQQDIKMNTQTNRATETRFLELDLEEAAEIYFDLGECITFISTRISRGGLDPQELVTMRGHQQKMGAFQRKLVGIFPEIGMRRLVT